MNRMQLKKLSPFLYDYKELLNYKS